LPTFRFKAEYAFRICRDRIMTQNHSSLFKHIPPLCASMHQLSLAKMLSPKVMAICRHFDVSVRGSWTRILGLLQFWESRRLEFQLFRGALSDDDDIAANLCHRPSPYLVPLLLMFLFNRIMEDPQIHISFWQRCPNYP
jgi:hypothetical protein